MAKPAEDSVGMPAPKPKLTAAQKKKADKELLLQEESRQAREQKQEVEKSVQIDQEAKAKEDENDRSDVGLIFNKSNRSEHNDYWLAHQALQSGNLEQLSKEQSALAEASNQQNERSSIDHKLAQEADVPEQWSSTAKADASTLQGSFQYSNVSMKYQKMQTDDVIKASTDVMPNYGKPWAGSAEETSHVWIILIGQFGIGDSAHATAVSAKLRCAEIKLRWSVHLQTLCLPLRGGIIKLLENIQIQNLKEVSAIVEKNPLDDLPESETKAVEAAPVDWADRQDESFLNLNTTKKKKKPRRKAVPTIESILSDIDEDENVEVINDDAVVVAGAVEVPKKAVKPRARKGKAVKAVEVDSEAIGDDGTVETPNQAPVKVKKPRARKTKTTGTTDVVPEAANNEDIQGPIEAPKKVLKPRASRPKAAKIVEIDSEVDNDDDENDGLGVPKNPFSQSNQGNSQVHAVKKSTAKPRAAAKKPQAKDESEDEDDDVPNIANSRPPRSRAVSKAIVVIDSDDDDDDDDQGGQAKSNKKKPAPRKVATKSQKTAETEVPKHIQALLDNTGTFLAGRTFVVSGTLPTVGRINTEKLSRLYGAKTSRAITKATTDVILGDNPLAKQVKELKDLSPNTMDVDAFIAMLTSLSKDNTNLVGGDDGEDGEEEIEDQPPAKRTKLGMDLSSASSALV
ncbi:replication factor RFC1 C terminal domain-containing protein [Botrytis cinerea]